MESRLFYVVAKIDKRKTIEDLDRLTETLRKYGIDTNDESVFIMDFKGNIKMCDLLFEQCNSVLRTIWNQTIDIIEVGEQVLDENDDIIDYPVYVYDKNRQVGVSSVFSDLEDYIDGKLKPKEDPEDIEEEDDDTD